MKVIVEGHVPAWCYVDTVTGEVELIEVWAWEDEFSFEFNREVVAEDAEEEACVTRNLADRARWIARENWAQAPFEVVSDLRQILIGRRPEALVTTQLDPATAQRAEVS